jgi:hypothetical protein
VLLDTNTDEPNCKSRPVRKKNLQSNICDNHRQEEISIECAADGHSGDGQDFGLDFQDAPSIDDNDQVDFENSNDITLAGSGDTEEYEIPDWALKPM